MLPFRVLIGVSGLLIVIVFFSSCFAVGLGAINFYKVVLSDPNLAVKLGAITIFFGIPLVLSGDEMIHRGKDQREKENI